MDTKTTNQVRQILMNELGLSRESIREEAQKIIKETVEQKVKLLFSENTFREMIYELLKRYYNELGVGYQKWDSFERKVNELLKNEIQLQVKKTILSKLDFHIEIQEDEKNGKDN